MRKVIYNVSQLVLNINITFILLNIHLIPVSHFIESFNILCSVAHIVFVIPIINLVCRKNIRYSLQISCLPKVLLTNCTFHFCEFNPKRKYYNC